MKTRVENVVDTQALRQAAPGSNPKGVSPEGIARLERSRSQETCLEYSTTLSLGELAKLRGLHFAARGIVLGSAVYHVEIPYGGYFQNQELLHMTKALDSGRDQAITRMMQEAERLEADGIIDVHLRVRAVTWAPDILEISAQGTAIVSLDPAAEAPIGKTPFTCALNVQQLGELTALSLRPVQIVFGNCVYHIAHQAHLQSLRHSGPNTELQSYTQALAGARELAIHRMEDTARAREAQGIVAVSLEESSHNWREHIQEYLAVGTAIGPAIETATFPKR